MEDSKSTAILPTITVTLPAAHNLSKFVNGKQDFRDNINATNRREFKQESLVIAPSGYNGTKPNYVRRYPAYILNDLLSIAELTTKNDSRTWYDCLEATKLLDRPSWAGIFYCKPYRSLHYPTQLFFPVLTFSLPNTKPTEFYELISTQKKLELKITRELLVSNIHRQFPTNHKALLLSVNLIQEENHLFIPFDLTFSSRSFSGKGKIKEWATVTGPNPFGSSHQSNLHYLSTPSSSSTEKGTLLWANQEDIINNPEFSRWVNESEDNLLATIRDSPHKDSDVYIVAAPAKESQIVSNSLQFLIMEEWNRITLLSKEKFNEPAPCVKFKDGIYWFHVGKNTIHFLLREKFETIVKKEEHIITFDDDLVLTLTPFRLASNGWANDLKEATENMKKYYYPHNNSDYYARCLFKLQLCCEAYEGPNTAENQIPLALNSNTNSSLSTTTRFGINQPFV